MGSSGSKHYHHRHGCCSNSSFNTTTTLENAPENAPPVVEQKSHSREHWEKKPPYSRNNKKKKDNITTTIPSMLSQKQTVIIQQEEVTAVHTIQPPTTIVTQRSTSQILHQQRQQWIRDRIQQAKVTVEQDQRCKEQLHKTQQLQQQSFMSAATVKDDNQNSPRSLATDSKNCDGGSSWPFTPPQDHVVTTASSISDVLGGKVDSNGTCSGSFVHVHPTMHTPTMMATSFIPLTRESLGISYAPCIDHDSKSNDDKPKVLSQPTTATEKITALVFEGKSTNGKETTTDKISSIDDGRDINVQPSTNLSQRVNNVAISNEQLYDTPDNSPETTNLLPADCVPVAFYDISDHNLRRSAQKLYKRLNYDPWDRFNQYNDDEVYQFVDENAATVAVQYGFAFFSGQLFPLSVLCALGASPRTIQRVHQAFPLAMDQCDAWIGTPLHYACSHRAKSTVVSYLIRQQSAMLQQQNQFERTPLHMACLFKASSKVVSLLLEAGPEITDVVDKDGYTPLHLACENGSSAEVVRLLIGGKAERCLSVTHLHSSTPLHLACANHANLAVVHELLNGSVAALDMMDDRGYSPFHVAIKQQASPAILELLIRANPDCIDVPTIQGYSVLSLAKHSHSSQQVLQLLMA